MRDLFTATNQAALAQMARTRVLVGLDYDGTLSPIVAKPERAGMRKETRRHLAAVAKLYPVAVISGRSRADVLERVSGVDIRVAVGNHGIEPWGRSGALRAQVRRWIPVVTQRLAAFEGLYIEDKTYSLAVHYRASPHKTKARAAILQVAADLGKVRTIGGKLVVNVVPEGAPHKGIALAQAIKKLRCETAIYVGDDDTDEDVFGLNDPERLFTVRVGQRRRSAAGYYLRDQRAIDRFLKLLVELRTP